MLVAVSIEVKSSHSADYFLFVLFVLSSLIGDGKCGWGLCLVTEPMEFCEFLVKNEVVFL